MVKRLQRFKDWKANASKDLVITELGEGGCSKAKYGNLFQMYEKITDDNPYETPMKIYPAVHYTMGGVWVDYNSDDDHSRMLCC